MTDPMLTGLFVCPLRKSGLLTLPVEWRAAFGERLVVTASLEEPGLLLWPVASFKGFEPTPEAGSYWRFVLAAAVELDVKANGSFRLPKRYRELARDADTLVSRGGHALWVNEHRLMRRESARLRDALARRGI
jgi:DNA-binding transcriptional regulator/RsmH inhibitor MraZ